MCRYQSVEGLHVCIPGGSSGIGLAVAKRCAADGAKRVTIIGSMPRLCYLKGNSRLSLCVSARRMEVLEKAAKEIREVNPACDVALVSCDITDPKKVDQMYFTFRSCVDA